MTQEIEQENLQENSREIKSRNIHEILNFCVNLSRQMVLAGANLERVHLAIEFICRAYGLKDLSIFLLSTHVSVSAYDEFGNYSIRQASIPPAGIHLERLKSLNQLSYKVAEITPNTKLLEKMLERSLQVRDYSDLIVLLGRVSAMSCLCFIFGGGIFEFLTVAGVTAFVHFIMKFFEKSGLDRILVDALTTWLATVAAIVFILVGLQSNLAVVMITVLMLMIPGVPLVNAMRNLFCNYEINGILQIFKIVIETLALAMGVFVAFAMFENVIPINEIAQPLSNPFLLIMFSYLASISFGVVFRIPPKDLWLAGLGGALSRISLLALTPLTSNRLLYMTISASIAALYAEFLATKRRQPSTYYIYPSIIPLIPGDLFFYAISGFYLNNLDWVKLNGVNCLLSLFGLSIGFVLSSTFAHYVRRYRYGH